MCALVTVINRFSVTSWYVKQNSLRPHTRENRERSKHGFGTVKERRKVFSHSQRDVTLSLQKARRRPRNVWSGTDGEGIRKSRIQPTERTNLWNSQNQVRIPHSAAIGIVFDFFGPMSSPYVAVNHTLITHPQNSKLIMF